MASGTYPLSLEIPGLPPCPERPEQVCAACLRLAQAVLPGEPLTFYPPSNLGPDGALSFQELREQSEHLQAAGHQVAGRSDREGR